LLVSLVFANGNRDERDAVAARAVAGARRAATAEPRGACGRAAVDIVAKIASSIATSRPPRCATASGVFRMHSHPCAPNSAPRRDRGEARSARAMPRFAHFFRISDQSYKNT
jgi:hypothetical protein